MGKFIQFLSESAISQQMDAANQLRDPVDRAIARYALDPTYKYEIDNVIDRAIQRYGNKTRATVYRGLNFDTKDEYDKFVNSVQDGTLDLDTISSWSPSEKEALAFAKTKPSFMEFMSAAAWGEIAKQGKTKERITGWRGVLLTTQIPANTGIDMAQSTYAKEREIILPPGTYQVTITDIKTFKDTLADSDVNTELSKISPADYSSDSEKRNFLEYMMHHHPDEFNDESKAKIFKLLNIRPFAYEISVNEKNDFMRNHDTIEVNIVPLDRLTRLAKFLRPEDTATVLRKSKPVFLKMLKEIQQQYKPGFVIDWKQSNPGAIADQLGVRQQYLTMLQHTVGKTYQDTTTREHNRKVTDIKGEANRIMALLQSIK